MEKGASQAETLNRAGGKRAYLAVERFAQPKLPGELRDSLGRGGARKQIQLTEEEQVFARSKPSVEAVVRARMITQVPANIARLVDGVVSRDARVAASGDKKRCKNSQKCRFACSVGAQERQRLSFANFERHTGQRDRRGLLEWLEKSAPTAARGGERFRESFDSDRGFGHQEPYSLSAVRRQSGLCFGVRQIEEVFMS